MERLKTRMFSIKINLIVFFLFRHLGWMQLVILIYHMTGASQVVPLYMQMRVLGLQLSLPHRIWPPVSLLEWRHRQFLSSIPSKTIEFVIPPAQN